MVLREVKRDVEGDPSLGLIWYIYIWNTGCTITTGVWHLTGGWEAFGVFIYLNVILRFRNCIRAAYSP